MYGRFVTSVFVVVAVQYRLTTRSSRTEDVN